MSYAHTYMISDLHLGLDAREKSIDREKRVVQWLDKVADDMGNLYLLGDIFHYWFEYKTVIPKGYTRFLGKLSELSDAGIKINFFTGNHDMWMFQYLTSEMGIPIFHNPVDITLHGKKFHIGHGDGLGPGDRGYKLLKATFSNPVCQWLYARLHPNFGISLMKRLSQKNSLIGGHDEEFLGREKEWLVQYAESLLKTKPIDYFVFGHRHLPISLPLSHNAHYYNLGDWISYNTYLRVSDEDIGLYHAENDALVLPTVS